MFGTPFSNSKRVGRKEGPVSSFTLQSTLTYVILHFRFHVMVYSIHNMNVNMRNSLKLHTTSLNPRINVLELCMLQY